MPRQIPTRALKSRRLEGKSRSSSLDQEKIRVLLLCCACLAPVRARVNVCVECWYVLMMHWHRDPAMYVHTHGVLPPSPPSAMLRRHGLEVQLPQHQWCRHPPTRTESFIPTLAQHQPFAIAPTLNFRGAGILRGAGIMCLRGSCVCSRFCSRFILFFLNLFEF